MWRRCTAQEAQEQGLGHRNLSMYSSSGSTTRAYAHAYHYCSLVMLLLFGTGFFIFPVSSYHRYLFRDVKSQFFLSRPIPSFMTCRALTASYLQQQV